MCNMKVAVLRNSAVLRVTILTSPNRIPPPREFTAGILLLDNQCNNKLWPAACLHPCDAWTPHDHLQHRECARNGMSSCLHCSGKLLDVACMSGAMFVVLRCLSGRSLKGPSCACLSATCASGGVNHHGPGHCIHTPSRGIDGVTVGCVVL